MSAYIFDIVIVLILVLFAWRGGKKGLILTLFGLAGLFVAFFGARFLSATFQEPVAGLIQPAIYRSVRGLEPGGEAPSADGAEDGGADSALSVEELLGTLRESDLFSGLTKFLDEDSVAQTGGRSAAQTIADSLAALAARAGLFALSFLVILLVWFLISHALDLAFQLPVLSTLNVVGGVLLGLVKAALLVIVLVWLAQLAGWVPAEPTTPVVSLFTPKALLGLLDRLLA